jgi:alpha-L-fucosidase
LFGTYYSICDWRHPDYPIEHQREGRKEGADMNQYIKYMKSQLRELVEKYHTKILWFDGEWEDPWTHEMGMDLYKYVRSLNDEIIINNRVDKGRRGMEGVSESSRYAGDFATPEQQVGRFDTLTPWESCITICTQWAWKPDDLLKTKEECIKTLVRTAGGDGNLLLNVGPKPDGTIEKRQADRLKEIGKWLDKNGESIYGTNGGPIPPKDWGITTHKGDNVYVHLLGPIQGIVIKDFPYEVTGAEFLDTGNEVSYSQKKKILRLNIPSFNEDEVVKVIKLDVKN